VSMRLGMSTLSIRQLRLRRGGKTVLRDISLKVPEGELLVVIGRSGSGKSSLLRCINRLNDIEAGAIRLDGRDITELSVTQLRRTVGMLFQKSTAFEGTVADNIGYGARLHGQNLSRAAILELMAQASLEAELVDEPAEKLSGGQEQRLAIARALALSPSLLLLDEPTSALDPIATKSVEAALLRLRSEANLTMIWVSHSIGQARRVGSRVLLLEEGRVLRVDSVDNMLNPETGDARALAFAGGDEAGLQA
ncbi:MAG: phosphate ABC transporter ATP-binding protein, partial [Chloroflexi bacterium]|nr:phosphate ABC transporter ATP-binding protein [Chloroflexota bacterium]